jgi:hypothetical protein
VGRHYGVSNYETLENNIKQSTHASKGGKRNKEREDPSLSQKNRTQRESQKGSGRTHVPKPHLSKVRFNVF